MDRDIYAYTTESNRLKDWVKIGETVKQEVDYRIRQQDGTACPEELEKIVVIDGVSFEDGLIRKEIERLKLGWPIRKEWMKIVGGVDKALEAIQIAINSLELGIVRVNSYKMRPEQQECHDKAVAAFAAGYHDFLMGTVMRYGKTFTSLMIAQTRGVQNALVITGKPEVRDSWRDELEQHVNFVDWNFVDLRDVTLSRSDVDFTKKNLFFVSFQYLLANAEGVDKTWINNLPIDLLFTDEEHHASKTEKSRIILDSFAGIPRVSMSGTPMESRMSGRYEEANSFYWSYREAALNNPDFPKLNIYGMDVARAAALEAASGGFVDENAFHINKMFAAENGKFLYESDVRSWLEKVFDLRSMSRTRRTDSPECIPGLQSQNFNHILMRVPYSVDAAVALAELLTELLPDRKIILASGSANGAVKDIAEVNRLIAQNDKTITVTCGRFETGVTVPEWGAVYLCDGGRSPEAYWQLIFRASTPYITDSWKKKGFYVFDFDPHRSLEMVYAAAATSRQSGQDMAAAITQWLDVAPILQHDGSQFVGINAENVLSVYDNMTAGNMQERYASDFGIQNIYKAEMLDILADISPVNARKIEYILNNNPDLEKGKLKKLVEKAVSAKEREELRRTRLKLKAVLRRIPMAVTKLGAVDIDSLLNTNDTEYFEATVGISIDDYENLINTGAIDRDWQDDCIINTANWCMRIDNQNSDALWKILGLYASMGSEVSPGTPKALANEILDALPEDVWSDPARVFYDPFLSNGMFYFLVVERLMKGLKNDIPDDKARLKHILQNQVYGATGDLGPYGFIRTIVKRFYKTLELGIEPSLEYITINGDKKMKFDKEKLIVVGNPPYQSRDGGHAASATPIYDTCVETVESWGAEYTTLVIPARWVSGGKGLTKFRRKMLNDDKIEFLKIFTNSKDCFPQNQIRGGICYFVRNINHTGNCKVVIKTGESVEISDRCLNEHKDLLIIGEVAVNVASKVTNLDSQFMNESVSSRKPFGLPTNFRAAEEKPFPDAIKLYQCHSIGYVKKNELLKNLSWINGYKVLIPYAGDPRPAPGAKVLGNPFTVHPDTACTETYLVAGRYDNQSEADNLVKFLKTKFARFLVSIVKKTQHGTKTVYRFVPQLDMTQTWTDDKLYKRYNLTQKEIEYIEIAISSIT